MDISVLGIDIAKKVMHLHGLNAKGQTVYKKKINRDGLLEEIAMLKADRIVMEACAGANYLARECEKLRHKVDLIAPQHVKPFVKGNKNDFKDAEAICEAACRPSMKFVPKRNEEQQDIQSLHRVRERLIRNRTSLVNEIRGFLYEYGIIIPVGRKNFEKSVKDRFKGELGRLSTLAQETFEELFSEYWQTEERVKTLEMKIKRIAASHPAVKKLMTIPGVGFITATAIIAAARDISVFKNGREFAAWLGLTPKEYSTGGKQRLSGITKRGDAYIRKLLVHGSRAVIQYLKKHETKVSYWARNLLERKGRNRTAVALANKNARVVWALLKNDECYKHVPVTL